MIWILVGLAAWLLLRMLLRALHWVISLALAAAVVLFAWHWLSPRLTAHPVPQTPPAISHALPSVPSRLPPAIASALPSGFPSTVPGAAAQAARAARSGWSQTILPWIHSYLGQ